MYMGRAEQGSTAPAMGISESCLFTHVHLAVRALAQGLWVNLTLPCFV